MILRGQTIASRAYKRTKKTNARTISANGDFLEVEFFATVDNQAFAVCRRLVVTEQPLLAMDDTRDRDIWSDTCTYLNNIFKRIHAASPYAPCVCVPNDANIQGPLLRVLDHLCPVLVN